MLQMQACNLIVTVDSPRTCCTTVALVEPSYLPSSGQMRTSQSRKGRLRLHQDGNEVARDRGLPLSPLRCFARATCFSDPSARSHLSMLSTILASAEVVPPMHGWTVRRR